MPEPAPEAALLAEYERVRRWLRAGPRAVHLMGAGGVGVAALAVLLKARGIEVTGCDAGGGERVEWLRGQGIAVANGHDPAHLQAQPDALVHTAAVRATHPECEAARRAGCAVFRRGVVLPALLEGRRGIAVTGTHGKTTTTAMIVQVLRAAGRDPSFAIGGDVDVLGGVAAAGRGEELVVEADESDGTVACYAPAIAVVTNAELDHVDHFASSSALHDCLAAFCARAQRVAVVGADDPGARAAGAAALRCVTFGFAGDADWRAIEATDAPQGATFTALGPGGVATRIALPVTGRHNVLNALAAIAVAAECGVPAAAAAAALARFGPARRRFERIAEGGGIEVISDYAHHPTEIAAMMTQAVALRRTRIVAVFQPHRYSRTKAFAAGFAESLSAADRLVLAPVYAASEPVVPGGRSVDVLPEFRARLGDRVELAESLDEAWLRLRSQVRRGDLLLIVGAGDVEELAFRARAELQSGGWPAM